MSDEQQVRGVDILSQILSLLEHLSAEERSKIVKGVIGYYSMEIGKESRAGSVVGTQARSVGVAASPVSFSEDLSISPKEFLLEKQPRTDVERIACLAYYLTLYRETPHFKTLDLSKVNTEAAQPKFANATWASNNAMKMGYLAQAAKGLRQLSAPGEQFVRALPDREQAKRVMETMFRRRRSRKPIVNADRAEDS